MSVRFVGVGIGEYDHYPQLPKAPEQVRQLADLLRTRGAGAVVAAVTTETGLIEELDTAVPQSDGNEPPLILLWAGHGDTAADAGLRLVAKNSKERGRPLLTAEYVASVVARSGSSQILLVLDTCFSGGGAVPALVNADKVLTENADSQRNVWLGVVASAMDWERARDGLFGDRLIRLLRDGPAAGVLQQGWSAHNVEVRGVDVIEALQVEWGTDAPQRLKVVQSGYSLGLIPNPLYDAAAPAQVVEHLQLAARGGEPDDERWYFTGRSNVIEKLVTTVRSADPGIQVVTGPAGSGKSAVLGMVTCMSNPSQREQLEQRGLMTYADPGEGAVHAHVYARGLARHQLARELDRQLSDLGILEPSRRGQRGPGELVDAVASSDANPVVLVDGLDEAGVEAWPIAEELLRPLSRHASILVGTRDLAPPEADATSLVTRLQPDESAVVDLPSEVDDAVDVYDYVLKRLADVDAPGMDKELVAAAVRDLPHPEHEGLFLLARMITAQLRETPIDTSHPDWQAALSTTVEQAFDKAIADLSQASRELLSALAWAQGAGITDDLWPVVATALSPTSATYDRGDVTSVLAQAGRYVVEAGESGRAVYRLAHQQLALHLRRATEAPDPELRIATALTKTYLDILASGAKPTDHPYLWRYLWRHCADAGPAGIDQLRRLNSQNDDAFLRDLASAFGYLAERYVEANQLIESVAPAEEAAELYRRLAADSPVAVPDLAAALNNLGNRYGEVGRRVDAVAATEEAVGLFRDLAEHSPAFRADLAMALNNLGVAYSDMGRRVDAVASAEEAVGLRWSLAEGNPAFRPDLASALNNLGVAYGEVGRWVDAVAPAEEAAGLYRDLTEDSPAFLSRLATALTNLGVRYRRVGRRVDAVTPAEEAARLYRDLAEDHPALRPDLASALNNLGVAYGEVGRWVDAVAPAEEAAGLFHDLAEHSPAFRPDLADALSNLGVRYGEVGRWVDAVAPTEEAVGLFRDLAEGNPAFLPNLAMALGNLGVAYGEVGRRMDVLTPTEEAVELFRALAEDSLAFRPDLAGALSNLGVRYGEVGRWVDAVAHVEEAVGLFRDLIEGNPAFLPDLAMALENLGNSYGEVGRREDAVAPVEEAVGLYRDLAEGNPAFLPNLASALGNLGIAYGEVGRSVDAVVPTEEAVQLRRDLAADNPAFLPYLAGALNNLGNTYGEIGRQVDALTPVEEAVELYRSLAGNNQALLPNLATALNNLGNRYRKADRPAESTVAAEEAVRLYQQLAAEDAAHLPDLAMALDKTGAGEIRWESAVTALPTPELKAGLLFEKARRVQLPQAVRDLLRVLDFQPRPADALLFRAHKLGRELRQADPDGFYAEWHKHRPDRPDWLLLDPEFLDQVADWLNTSTHAEARDYHIAHVELLASPGAQTALDECALAGAAADTVQQYRELLSTAAAEGIDAAYSPLVLAETLTSWLNADLGDQVRLLELVTSDTAMELLEGWHDSDPENSDLVFGSALVRLARAGLHQRVLDTADQLDQLRALLAELLDGEHLFAAAVVLLRFELEQSAEAEIYFYLAIAFAEVGQADDAMEEAHAARELGSENVQRWVNLLAQRIPQHPELAALIPILNA